MKKTKKIITLLSVLLMIMFALPAIVEAKEISSRRELISGPNVGNTVYLGNGRHDGTISLFNENDHLYCVQHRASTQDAMYRVDAYVEISGTQATAYTGSSGKTVRTYNSSMNTVLAYICGEQNYYKGYNNSYTNDGVRMRAIHKYLQAWYNSVGFSKLGINRKWNDQGFSLDNHIGVKARALRLISDGQKYARDTNSNVPKVDKNSTSKYIEEISSKTFGPFKIKYTGIIDSVIVKDASGNTVNNIAFSKDKEGKNTVKVSDLKSNENYYLQNNSGKLINTVSFKLKDSEVLSAKLWFLERKDGRPSQRILMTETGKTKAKGETYVMKVMPKISIKGYVWVDVQRTKANNTNSLWDNDEQKVAGVTVKLINKSSKKEIATTKTNANGEYIFNKPFTALRLKDYYVEFNYNGVNFKYVNYTDNGQEKQEINEDISKYIPVAFNSTNVNEIRTNGSRALMDNVAVKDTDLSGIASTYKGTEKEKIYGLGLNGNLYQKLISEDGLVLANINLGIKKIPETTYEVRENIAYVKIQMKGYEYTYSYAGTGDKSKVAAPIVRFQDGSSKYTYLQDIYPSDIAYDIKNSTEELKVYVTYRIDVTNTTKHNIEDLYKEQKLFITKLTNTYDSNRYELNDENWNGSNGTVTMNEKYRKSIFDSGIEQDKSAKPVYITFKVKHDKNNDPEKDPLVKLLNNPNGLAEEFPTKVTTTGYHQYTRKDYSWQNDLTKQQTHMTKNINKEWDAPYLTFRLGQERILSGKVFEDKSVSTDGQKLGNGKYDDKENIVKDVIVELLDVKENVTDITQLPVSNVYGVEGDEKNRTAISNPAQVKTDVNGNYTLNGIVPGKYYLRYTYGDGTQKIYTTDGKEVKTLVAKEYKSTIITNNVAKTALKGGTDEQWYKKLNSQNDSVAIDNLNTRIAVNQGTSTNIMSGTAKIDITIENTINNIANIEVTENGQKALASNKFDGLNLGIIEQPNQNVNIEKIITKIKLTNSQINNGFEGNPEKDTMQGVSDLDGIKNEGSTYTRAELPDEMISGATLELTYRINITNISDINYYNNAYYWYGEADKNKEVALDINEVADYLDNTLQFKAESSDTRIKLATETPNEGKENKTILVIGEIGKLYTEKNKARENDKLKTSDTVNLVAERKLSTQDDDMEFVNETEITKINNGKDSRDNSEGVTEIQTVKPIEEKFEAKARATITPPTGEDRQEIIMYVIAGVIALAILSAGVVLIKKIVTK